MPAVFKNVDVLVEAFDDATYKAMLTEAYAYSGKFFVGASGLGGYGNSDRIVAKKIHNTFYIVGDGVTEVTGSVKPFAPCVMITAAKQADLVLAWVLGRL
jgi:sulfur carrier protein ThiS adenylyltransferase